MDPLRLVFPRPRSVEPLGGATPAHAPVTERPGAEVPAEGYRLGIQNGRIELAFADEAGRRYGQQTLAQLRSGDSAMLRDCRIDDAPDLPTRGYMLDVSRDRVPTRACLEALVERLAAFRYNHLQLYTEHAFAYADHELVWKAASPITPEDVLWLDRLCTSFGIELAANQNTFGHMERWLRHERYRPRAECPEGFEQAGRRRGPTALAPNADNAAFALGLVRELLSSFSSRRVNIGCDEVWELGRGASAGAVAAHGPAEVFVQHLRRIAEPLLADGYEVQFWADMLQKAPQAAAPLAEAGAVAAVWGYERPADYDPAAIDFEAMPESIREVAREYLTQTARGFGPRLRSFRAAGFRTWAVPGTSGWNSFVGRHANARGNLLDAVEACLANGAEGILVTEWGDHGHLQPPFVTLPAMAYGGATAWCRATNGDLSDAELAAAVSRLVGDPTGRFGHALVELGLVGETLGGFHPNGTGFFYALVDSGLPMPLSAPTTGACEAALARIDASLRALSAADPQAEDGRLLVRECRQAGALAHLGIRTLAARTGAVAGDAAELARERAELREEQRACWLARSRPGGLEDSLARLAPTGR